MKLAWLAFAVLITGGRCRALPLSGGSPGWTVRVWQAEEGLPATSLTAITQTHDGYLWVGTYSGLARFDGLSFKVYEGVGAPGLCNGRITALYEDAAGALWIGHETGEISRRVGGQFEKVEIGREGGGASVVAFGCAADGILWALDHDGRVERVSRALNADASAGLPAAAGSGAVTLTEGGGRLWALRDGVVSEWRDGAWREEAFGDTPRDRFIAGIAASRDGGLWVAAGGRLRQWQHGRWERDWGACPWGDGSVTLLAEMRNGAVAAGTLDRGLFVLAADGLAVHWGRSSGLAYDWARCFCEDREGNLWVGAGSGGLSRLRRARVEAVASPDLFDGHAPLSVSSTRDGSLWVGTEGAGIYQNRDGQWRRFGPEAGLSNLFVWALAEDATGAVWAGTWGGGLYRRIGDGFAPVAGIPPSVSITALLPDGEQGFWVGTGVGLWRWPGDPRGPTLAPGADGDVRALCGDGAGGVWFGCAGRGLGRWDRGAVRRYRRGDGLPSDFVQSLWRGPEGEIWIGTADSGLCRFKSGAFAGLGSGAGPPNHVICAIAGDAQGFLWVSTHGGVFRAARADLDACADGQTRSVRWLGLGRGDGLPTLECTGGLQGAVCGDAAGRLWFSTPKGIAKIDPGSIQPSPVPPRVVVEEVLGDGKALRLVADAADPLAVRPGVQRLEFHFAGLSFSAPEKVVFRCRLKGLQNEWTDLGPRRSLIYPRVPPGDYHFEVMAANGDGVWSESAASVAIRVAPRIWETSWFRFGTGGAAILAIVTAAVWDSRRRLRVRIERAERQEAVERERMRIAQDIHDDLGASLTRITWLSQWALAGIADGATGAAELDQISATAREMTRAMDEIVWAVNPRHDTLASLAGYFGRYAQEYLGPTGIRCRLDIPVELPEWPVSAEVRHNLFLAFKEALHNAVRHAGAREIRVALACGGTGFAIDIQDDGCGFVVEPAGRDARPGDGLVNLRRRLNEIGGVCEITAAPGSGTRVRLISGQMTGLS